MLGKWCSRPAWLSSPIEGYHASRAPDAYPLREIMALAARAIERDPAHLDVFVDAL